MTFLSVAHSSASSPSLPAVRVTDGTVAPTVHASAPRTNQATLRLQVDAQSVAFASGNVSHICIARQHPDDNSMENLDAWQGINQLGVIELLAETDRPRVLLTNH